MKKQFLTTTLQLISVMLLLLIAPAMRAQSVAITVAFLTPEAGNETLGNHPGGARSAAVRCVGSVEGGTLYNVVYTNSTGARFSIKVLDNEGHQLFQGVYTDKQFDRKFKIADARNYDKLTFIIRNFQDNSVQTFEIDSTAPVTEEAAVKKIK